MQHESGKPKGDLPEVISRRHPGFVLPLSMIGVVSEVWRDGKLIRKDGVSMIPEAPGEEKV